MSDSRKGMGLTILSCPRTAEELRTRRPIKILSVQPGGCSIFHLRNYQWRGGDEEEVHFSGSVPRGAGTLAFKGHFWPELGTGLVHLA